MTSQSLFYRLHESSADCMTQCQWVMKVYSFDAHFVHTSESNFKLVFGPFIEIWIIFVSSNSFCPSWNAATRSSHQVWPRHKDVQYHTVTLFLPSFQYRTWMSISLFCILSYRDLLYKTDINGDFNISSKIMFKMWKNHGWSHTATWFCPFETLTIRDQFGTYA